jgi:Zn-dependent M28 family amino/carboxypeptidase
MMREIHLGDDLVLDARAQQPAKINAPLLFVGYGLHLPETGYDDFKDVDIKGKIIVYILGAPLSVSGPMQAFGRAEALARTLESRGALGAIGIQTEKNMDIPWERVKLASLQPGMYLSENDLRRYHGVMFLASFNPAMAQQLFAHAPENFATLSKLADAHQPLPHFDLGLQISAEVVTDNAHVRADNIVAELPGNDPAYADQALVLSAHLDHLGTGKPDNGDGIFRGAMDNASGVASLLEIARAMKESGAKPKRSILFLAVNGEEKGLLGSRFFASHPTRHVGKLVADINMDMFLPLYPFKRMVAFGGDESSLGDDALAVAKAQFLQIVPDPAPDRLIFIRSDQYSFIRRGVPSLYLAFAPAPKSAEEAMVADWLKQRYHAQADNLDQPIDLQAAEDFNHFLMTLITRVANEQETPHWRVDSFFARFAQSPLK